MSYEIRRTPKNRYQLRESPRPVKKPTRGKTSASGEGLPDSPPLGEFESTEAAAQYALQHAKGEFEWKPFEPREELDRQRKQLEGR